MLRYFFCKVICICQNGSVAGRQPPGEDVGEGCSVPAAHQNGRSSILNILGNSWGLPVHVLRVICIFSPLWCRRIAPPSWLRLDCRHCTTCCHGRESETWISCCHGFDSSCCRVVTCFCFSCCRAGSGCGIEISMVSDVPSDLHGSLISTW